LGILQNLDVSESALKHKQMGKKFGSIRGRQATVNALIGNELNLDVSESALKHKQMGKKFGSIRGRQATVNALIGNEHYPKMRRLRISIRLSVTKTE